MSNPYDLLMTDEIRRRQHYPYYPHYAMEVPTMPDDHTDRNTTWIPPQREDLAAAIGRDLRNAITDLPILHLDSENPAIIRDTLGAQLTAVVMERLDGVLPHQPVDVPDPDQVERLREDFTRLGESLATEVAALKPREDQVDGRDVYAAWCLALKERFAGPSLNLFRTEVEPSVPKDFAYLTPPEQHAWELLADSINNDCSVEDAIAAARRAMTAVSDQVDEQVGRLTRAGDSFTGQTTTHTIS